MRILKFSIIALAVIFYIGAVWYGKYYHFVTAAVFVIVALSINLKKSDKWNSMK